MLLNGTPNLLLGVKQINNNNRDKWPRCHVRYGSEADTCGAKRGVRFAPNSDSESDFSQKRMSALTPKADVCSALVYVG